MVDNKNIKRISAFHSFPLETMEFFLAILGAAPPIRR